jgi:hypothetical protein
MRKWQCVDNACFPVILSHYHLKFNFHILHFLRFHISHIKSLVPYALSLSLKKALPTLHDCSFSY